VQVGDDVLLVTLDPPSEHDYILSPSIHQAGRKPEIKAARSVENLRQQS
jgi:hypothetical protein